MWTIEWHQYQVSWKSLLMSKTFLIPIPRKNSMHNAIVYTHVAGNFSSLTATDGFLNVSGTVNVVISRKRCKIETLLLQATNGKYIWPIDDIE